MDQALNYDIEKLINSHVQQIKFIEQNNICDEPERLEVLKIKLQSIIEIKNHLLEKNFKDANTTFFTFRSKYKNKIQNELIEPAIDFYKTNPELDYPTDYQAELEQTETSIQQKQSPSQNIDQINFDKLMDEIADIKARPSELTEIFQNELKSINSVLKEITNTQSELKKVKLEAEPSDANLAPRIESLVTSLNKLESLLKVFTNPNLAYADLQSNMSKHITDMNNIVMKNVEEARDKFILALSGDVAAIKKEMNAEAVNLISELGTVNKQNHQDYAEATKKDFEKNKATIQQYLNDEHKNAQNYAELKEELELSKNNLVWWIGGVIVVMLIVNFFTVLSMNQTISKTVSARVVNSIEEMRDTQAPKITPAPNTNKSKKY